MRFIVAVLFAPIYEIVILVASMIMSYLRPLKEGFVKGISRGVQSEVRRLKLGADRLFSFLALKAVF